jgi:hypothetical protein
MRMDIDFASAVTIAWDKHLGKKDQVKGFL